MGNAEQGDQGSQGGQGGEGGQAGQGNQGGQGESGGQGSGPPPRRPIITWTQKDLKGGEKR
ncbi:MAG: hypothetical protein HYY03_02750 [Chloroflexi bacterium]|nr:hypothetical protein [Chloroflexota bacterium]